MRGISHPLLCGQVQGIRPIVDCSELCAHPSGLISASGTVVVFVHPPQGWPVTPEPLAEVHR